MYQILASGSLNVTINVLSELGKWAAYVKFYRFTSFSHYKEYYIANYFYKGE
jgi:hypothetical protein